MNKIDKELLKIIISESTQKPIECFVYVTSLPKAKRIFLQKNIDVLQEFAFISGMVVCGQATDIFGIAKNDVVEFVSSLSHVSALVGISKCALKFDKIEFSGQNVAIAYIDTGIAPHLDFLLGKKRITHFLDLINNKTTPYDDNGHGTFVSGVGSGSGVVSGGKFAGFAKDSSIVSIKALNSNGEASASKILQAMQWIYDNHKQYNIRVVCMSFGSEPLGANDPIMQGAEALWKSGVVVVAAAGNSGPEYQTIKSPGISPKIITVGGINDNRIDQETFSDHFFEIASFSSRGPALKRFKPDLVAPSVDINSCCHKDKFYTRLSGTSVSTPMIAGICACALEKNSSLTPDQIKKHLLYSCKPITFNKNFEGYGILNAEKFFANI
jgi:serine protease AprX